MTFPGIAQGSTATRRGKPHTVGSGVHVFQLKGHIIFSCSWTPSFFWRMDVHSFETLYVRFWTVVWKQTAVGRETPTSGGVCSLEDLDVRGPEFGSQHLYQVISLQPSVNPVPGGSKVSGLWEYPDVQLKSNKKKLLQKKTPTQPMEWNSLSNFMRLSFWVSISYLAS